MANLIFTNHTLERIKDRKMTKEMVLNTFSSPDNTLSGKKPGTTEFIKKISSQTVTMVATQNEKREWIALSAWIDPPFPGTKDFREKEKYRKYKKSGFWGKVWLSIKSQLGF